MACWHTSITNLSNGRLYIKSGNRDNSYRGKFWVARITGKDPKYTFTREFVNDFDGAEITKDGFYQVFRECTWGKRPESYFIKVVGNDYDIVNKEAVLAEF